MVILRPCSSCFVINCSLVTNAVHKINRYARLNELVGRLLPVVHSISGDPLVPGGHLHTNIAPSRMHSAPLPHPFVRQSKLFSALPVLAIGKIENHREHPSIFSFFLSFFLEIIREKKECILRTI